MPEGLLRSMRSMLMLGSLGRSQKTPCKEQESDKELIICEETDRTIFGNREEFSGLRNGDNGTGVGGRRGEGAGE